MLLKDDVSKIRMSQECTAMLEALTKAVLRHNGALH